MVCGNSIVRNKGEGYIVANGERTIGGRLEDSMEDGME